MNCCWKCSLILYIYKIIRRCLWRHLGCFSPTCSAALKVCVTAHTCVYIHRGEQKSKRKEKINFRGSRSKYRSFLDSQSWNPKLRRNLVTTWVIYMRLCMPHVLFVIRSYMEYELFRFMFCWYWPMPLPGLVTLY